MLTSKGGYLRKTVIPVSGKRLDRAMSKICFEYSMLVGDRNFRYHHALRKAIIGLRLKVSRIESLLILSGHKNVSGELKKACGTSDIQKAIIELKNLRIQLETKLEEVRKMDVQKPENNEEVYLRLEASLSKYLGFPINEKRITVARIASYQRLLKKEADGQQRNKRAGR